MHAPMHEGEVRTEAPEGGSSHADGENLVMRPITSKAAIEIARQMMEQGVPGFEEREDGRIWALGVDRRARGRKS
jgi:hypothetical protein